MTRERLAKIVRLVTAIDDARNVHRGRTVPAITSGGPHDGRKVVEGDADGFRVEQRS